MLLEKSRPHCTHAFGSLGATLESALCHDFLRWFHLEETGRRPEEPGNEIRFRPSGDKFHNLCSLDILTASGGELVQMELAVSRSLLDGPDALFAQDLVKSFLIAALPDACRSALQDFMREIATPGAHGATPPFLAFRGSQEIWKTETGWTRLLLANLQFPEGSSLVIQVAPNPDAPNAVPIPLATSAS